VRSNAISPRRDPSEDHVLAERQQTELDVFDLDLLIAQHPDAVRRGDVSASLAGRAVQAAFAISFDAYRDLVVDFLEDEFVEIYDRREVWDEMVLRVVAFLETLQ
jgi:hypothetical protein